MRKAVQPIRERSTWAVLSARSLALIALAPAAGVAAEARPPPDIEGIWIGGTMTPFERPPELADKPAMTPAELEEHQRAIQEKFWAAGHKPDDVGRDNDAFIDERLDVLPNGQTSLVVDPANGLVPLRPEAERRRDINLRTFDSYETMSQWDRCITREPTPLFPSIYNNAYQIIQTPTHVVISAEMVHDTRIIPLDGSPHMDSRIRSWNGDSRGHWDGDTLVVDSTNFNGKGYIATAQAAGRIKGVPYTEDLHIVERFTRIDDETLRYEITIDDPAMYESAWTVAFPLKRDDTYHVFEYACHEGNDAVELILRGARTEEQSAEAKAQ